MQKLKGIKVVPTKQNIQDIKNVSFQLLLLFIRAGNNL
jgi:hypothetical protein